MNKVFLEVNKQAEIKRKYEEDSKNRYVTEEKDEVNNTHNILEEITTKKKDNCKIDMNKIND